MLIFAAAKVQKNLLLGVSAQGEFATKGDFLPAWRRILSALSYAFSKGSLAIMPFFHVIPFSQD